MVEGSERDVFKSISCVVLVDNNSVSLKGYLFYILFVNWYIFVVGIDMSFGVWFFIFVFVLLENEMWFNEYVIIFLNIIWNFFLK